LTLLNTRACSRPKMEPSIPHPLELNVQHAIPVSPPAAPDAVAADERLARVVERPDGYYWLGFDGHQEFGPFADLDETLGDMEAAEDDAFEPGETLAEAEREIGIAEWIDPDTGEPAEDTATRIPEG
jgi:hypothetical protein